MKNIKSRSKSKSKGKPKNKTCKRFCEEVFIPERERVEVEFSKKLNGKFKYRPIKVLRKMNDNSLANILESMYLKSCDDIYCQKSCKNNKKPWLNSFTKKRKDKLIEEGAISGCRDLVKEFPKYYKNI